MKVSQRPNRVHQQLGLQRQSATIITTITTITTHHQQGPFNNSQQQLGEHVKNAAGITRRRHEHEG